MNDKSFQSRHLGPRGNEVDTMLNAIGVESLDQLIYETVPDGILLKEPLDLEPGMTEYDYARHIGELAAKNKVFKSYIGLGYYNCIVPAVIQRNILENPGWYTAYTPYQAEIAQGRLEGLLNFQTLVSDLTAMEIANASLLDEGTAAAEAMIMFYNTRSRADQKAGVNKFFVAEDIFPQTLSVVQGRAAHLGIDLVIGDPATTGVDNSYFGALLQYPNAHGRAGNYSVWVEHAHEAGVKVAVAADLLSLTLLTPPGEWGADAVVGTTQRFGVPMGFGGPHAAYFATHEDNKRHLPGRIIGVSKDRRDQRGLRMALQTREQHIRRDKATSNICTAQALLAIMAGMYGVYHGPEGLKGMASHIHRLAATLARELGNLGMTLGDEPYFDTIHLTLPEGKTTGELAKIAETAKVNLRYINDSSLTISLDETTSLEDVNTLIALFCALTGNDRVVVGENDLAEGVITGSLQRSSDYLTHPVFHQYRSESEMMRYLKRLENRDISLTHSMISLGSCTMKLNAASELYPITRPEFANMHPFAPKAQTEGYMEMVKQLERDLCVITGFDAMSLQPNSGAQGEYSGLAVIRAYQEHNGQGHRNIALIPSSAHGTNPASAVMAGMKVVVVKCDEAGNIDIPDLRAKAEQHSDNLSALMVTYPSTHGVFEAGIKEITQIVHDNGGQVYMDGANMNAQVGVTNPATIGADVCHLNLHKTFAIPHGGGGPGMGPIGVKAHLAPFLPSNPLVKTGGEHPIDSISAAPWGSALILLISYGYIKMLGREGVTESTRYAILNANYLKAKLDGAFEVLYVGEQGRIAHEMIIDCRDFKKTSGVVVEDIAKRLIDYGFHAPTVSFPVAGTMMIEPTESEALAELDRFSEALLNIRQEIAEIENGQADENDNVLKMAPHTANEVVSDQWSHAYSREKAVFPLDWTRESKFWPFVSRIDNGFGDRNLVCTCPPMEDYMELEAEEA